MEEKQQEPPAPSPTPSLTIRPNPGYEDFKYEDKTQPIIRKADSTSINWLYVSPILAGFLFPLVHRTLKKYPRVKVGAYAGVACFYGWLGITLWKRLQTEFDKGEEDRLAYINKRKEEYLRNKGN